METNRESIGLVKLTKEEKKKQREDARIQKREAYERIPEKDREKKKKYKKLIWITAFIFAAALVVLGCMAVGILPSAAGILLLVILSVASTFITRKDR